MKLLRLVVAVLLLASASSLKADAPDPTYEQLAGKWKLDFSRSEIGKEKEVPKAVIAEISYSRPEVHLKVTKVLKAGPDVQQYRYSTIGKESVNFAEGMNWKSTGFHGANGKFTLDQRAKYMLFTIDVNDKWTLSEGGKVLTIERKISSIPRNDNIRYVFERESS